MAALRTGGRFADRRPHGRLVGLLALATIALFSARWYAAHRLGFGDAEALYAIYARYPHAIYLDHPGLIGLIARTIGAGDCPSPFAAHVVTAIAATAAPWVVALLARSLGGSWAGSLVAGLVVAVTPMTSVGLYGFTPDLPLFFAWYAAIACAAKAQGSTPGSTRALVFTLAAALSIGLACMAKVSGVLLLVGVALAYASEAGRRHLRTLAPYLGIAIVAVLLAPLVREEVARSLPMLRHRLVDTQRDAGLSWRNVVALVGGQLLYLTPPALFAAIAIGRDLYAKRDEDATSRILWCVTVAASPLLLLCLVSRVAEPHWPAPMYLALPLHWARTRSRTLRPRWGLASVSCGVLVTALAHAWVLWPLGPWLAPEAARYDLATDLVAWQSAQPTLRRALAESETSDAPEPFVVGAHWTICAQLAASLPRSVHVGCNSPEGDDWNDWLPRTTWQHAPVVLYVTDSRGFGPAPESLGRHTDRTWSIPIHRGGLVVRTMFVKRLTRSALASPVRAPARLDR